MTRAARDGAARAATAADCDSVARCDSRRQVAVDAGSDSLLDDLCSAASRAMDREPRAAPSREAVPIEDREVSGSPRPTAVLAAAVCRDLGYIDARRRSARGLDAERVDHGRAPRPSSSCALSTMHFCYGTSSMYCSRSRSCALRSSSGLTKWGSPRMMHSLVMLTTTRNQASAPRAAACTGWVWSGSGQPGGPDGLYRRDRGDRRSRRSTWSQGAVMASQMCRVRETRRTHEQDSTRKQSIPHPRGAPDS